MDKAQIYLNQLDKELSKYPLAVEAEKRTHVPKTYMVAAVVGLFAILTIFNIFGALITTLLGFLWPAYQSYKAIEDSDKENDTQWLTYWTVFGFFNVIEVFTDVLLYWIPFYYAFKSVIILYLILPQFQGAKVVYVSIISPYLLKKQSGIDADIAKFVNRLVFGHLPRDKFCRVQTMSIPSSVADCDNKHEPRFSLPESTLHRPLAARERVDSVPSNHAEIGSPYPDVIEIRRTLERPARPSKSSSNGTRASSLIVCPSESREIEPMNKDMYASTTLDHNRPETVTRPFSLAEVPGEAEESKRGEKGLLETSLHELDKSAEQQFNKMLSSSAPDLLEARFTLRKGHDRVKLDHLVLTDAMYDLVLDLAQWIKDPCTKYSESRKARNEFYREMCFYLFILLIALLGTVVWMLPPFSTHVYLEGGVSEDIHFEIWYLVSRVPLMVISMALFIQFCIVIYQVHPPPLLQLLAYAVSLVLDYQLLSMAVAQDYTPGGTTSFFQTHFQIVSGISLVLALLPPAGIVLVAYYLVRQKSNKRLSGISLHMDENEEPRTARDFFLSLVSFQETANREGRTYGRSEFIGLLLMSAWGFATYIWCQVAYTFTLWLLRRAGVLISRAFIRAELFKTAIFPIYASEVYAFMFSRNMLLSVDTVEMMLILEVGRVIVDDIL
ncbi:ER membrane protein DP1/Yop1, partial [Chytriomyces hyalinus]